MRVIVRTVLDSFAAGSFAISALLTALRTTTMRPDLHTERALLDDRFPPLAGLSFVPSELKRNLLGPVSQPGNPVLWTLLAAVVIATGLHLISRLHRREPQVREGALALGLLCGAVWPWVLNPIPLAGLALAVASCLLLVGGIMPGPRGRPPPAVDDLPIAFVAGWMLMAATSALGMYVHHRLGLELERSVLIGLLPAALLGAWFQLRMEGGVTYSLALIWGMIGFAAATAGSSITIATACVLGISALAVVVVRVTT